MTPKKTLTTIITTAAVGLGAALFATPAAAATPDPVCVDIGFRFIGPRHVNATPDTYTVNLPASIPAGPATVEVWTSDTYTGRADTGHWHQQSERVSVLGVATSDLPDWVESATGYTSGVVELTGPVSSVTVAHLHAGGINSVQADRVCVTPAPAPVPAPQPEPQPELEPEPVVEHPEVLIPEHAPTPEPAAEPAPEPVCEDEQGEPCLPACPTGEMRTRTSGTACEAIQYCPPVPVYRVIGEYDAIVVGEVEVMSPTGLLEDCPGTPDEVAPVKVTYRLGRCIVY